MRGEILGLERRRRWNAEEKLSIVLSVGVDGATVTQVTRSPSGVVTRWNRKHRSLFV